MLNPAGEQVTRLGIGKFDMKRLKPDRTIYIVGKRGTGKSHLVKDILSYLYAEYDAGVAMSPTPSSLADFREYIPDAYIYEEYDGAKIEEIIGLLECLNAGESMQTKVVERFPKVFIVLDDLMYDKKILKSVSMKNLHNNGRHKKVLFINIAQYVMDISRDIRSQIDYIFILKENKPNLRRTLHNEFFPFEHFEHTCQAMDKFTDDNGCIVLDMTTNSNRLEDQIFWYKAAKNPPSFLLGNRDYWKLHYYYYVPRTLKFHDGGCPIPGLETKHGGSRLRPAPPPQNSAAKQPKKPGARTTIILEKEELKEENRRPTPPSQPPPRFPSSMSNVSHPSAFSQSIQRSLHERSAQQKQLQRNVRPAPPPQRMHPGPKPPRLVIKSRTLQ